MFKRLFKKEGLEIIHVKTVNEKPKEWGGKGR